MKKELLIAVLLGGLLPSAGAFAAGCATPRNAFDTVYCMGNVFSQVDRDLNVEYGTLRKMLNTSQQGQLKKGQLAWIKQRDEACSYERPNGYFVNLNCAVEMSQERTEVLKARERECKSTGCDDSKLAQ